MKYPKQKPWRSAKYLKWVRTQPCCMCDELPNSPGERIEAHHLIGVGGWNGMGTKAPDWATMPLCKSDFTNVCHDEMNQSSKHWDEQWEMIARTLGKAIDEGILK